MIINNRFYKEDAQQPLSKNLENEAKRLGIQYWYLSIPQDATDIIDSRTNTFRAALPTVDGSTIVFCRIGRRSLELVNLAEKIQADRMPSK